MILVIGEPEDDHVLWLTAGLRRRGVVVDFVLPEELQRAQALSLRIDAGASTSVLELADGRIIRAEDPAAVVNRLTVLPAVATRDERDAAYLAAEWQATVAAWLRTFPCPVLNPPRVSHLPGPALPPSVWRRLAHAEGMSTVPWHSDELVTPVGLSAPAEIVVLGELWASPDVPPPVAAGLVALGRRTGAPLLGATFETTDGTWALAEVTPLPRLARCGNGLVDAIAALDDREVAA